MPADRENSEGASNVVRRIRRFLAGLESARRQPNRREAYHICMAIEHLETGEIPESEEALRKADQRDPMPPNVASQVAYNETPTVQQLRAVLDRLKPG